eukprot:GEZU01010837.1.p1 GENE.GEZU01010837.1~~GEZU01010837.1.p1  ORF type:complete len:764 (+),score=261.47 GEZU01010837.1:308-2293(+)
MSVASRSKFEDVRGSVFVMDAPSQIHQHVARKVADLIKAKAQAGQKCVLGLPTGSTPIGVYRALAQIQKKENISFEHVITFNLDEYYPMEPTALQSYHRFMWENFFSEIQDSGIKKENIHIPDGTVPLEKVDEYCAEYERMIQEAGGIDLMMLGLGRSGHIGFNEPGSTIDSKTRLVYLDQKTRTDAATDFFGLANVPKQAITMGVSTILSAKNIIMIATGEGKAGIVKRVIEDDLSKIGGASECPAAFLRQHANTEFYFDAPAAAYLMRSKAPWLVRRNLDWKNDLQLTKRAVVYLSQTVKKPILDLTANDFYDNYLTELLIAYNDNHNLICEKVYNDILKRIMMPTGEGTGLDETIFNTKEQKVLVFSPHPDDDVISMGGMFYKLINSHPECHNVKVAYMTNGSIAVDDGHVRNFLRLQSMSAPLFPSLADKCEALDHDAKQTLDWLANKQPRELDLQIVQSLKGNIRKAEAIAAIEILGLKPRVGDEINYNNNSAYCFLDLPFYRTGEVKKKPIGKEDIDIVLNLLNEFKPDHIFVAGDLTDPHGTHRMCYAAIKEAVKLYEARDKMSIWLYRGAWQEWDVHETSLFCPMNRTELDIKINSIFRHQSQKDKALFPGNDPREFWQRARDRNENTANLLASLGFPRFHACEAYVKVDEMP